MQTDHFAHSNDITLLLDTQIASLVSPAIDTQEEEEVESPVSLLLWSERERAAAALPTLVSSSGSSSSSSSGEGSQAGRSAGRCVLLVEGRP
jgi:hypothetical protein